MRFGFVGPSYTAKSNAVADEECINLFSEAVETQGSVSPAKAYGGQTAQSLRNYYKTPGLAVFSALSTSPTRGSIRANDRAFAVSGNQLYEVFSDGTNVPRGTVGNDGKAASFAFNSIQLLVVSNGQAFCYDLTANTLTEVTSDLAGVPVKVVEIDTYFIVCFADSNKFQMSQVLDGTTWPGLLVNEVSVFPENITSIEANHRELWVFGSGHCQVYQDTGSDEVFDVVPGALIETGNIATFAPCRLDNSIFWVNEDERGGRSCGRSSGYTPQRISTHAVEADLNTYSETQIEGLVTYAYQDQGHLFWLLYIPGAQWSWVYDVGEGMWHKRAYWDTGTATYSAHRSWNHMYVFGKHLVGDWNSGNLYEMKLWESNGTGGYNFVTDNGNLIRWLRRSPTVIDEMQYIRIAGLTVDIQTGLGPQPPLTDGAGNPRAPQVSLRWSDDRGQTWSNEHIADCGMAGQYKTRVRWLRLGQTRYRVWELSGTDPVPVVIVDAYMTVAA